MMLLTRSMALKLIILSQALMVAQGGIVRFISKAATSILCFPKECEGGEWARRYVGEIDGSGFLLCARSACPEEVALVVWTGKLSERSKRKAHEKEVAAERRKAKRATQHLDWVNLAHKVLENELVQREEQLDTLKVELARAEETSLKEINNLSFEKARLSQQVYDLTGELNRSYGSSASLSDQVDKLTKTLTDSEAQALKEEVEMLKGAMETESAYKAAVYKLDKGMEEVRSTVVNSEDVCRGLAQDAVDVMNALKHETYVVRDERDEYLLDYFREALALANGAIKLSQEKEKNVTLHLETCYSSRREMYVNHTREAEAHKETAADLVATINFMQQKMDGMAVGTGEPGSSVKFEPLRLERAVTLSAKTIWDSLRSQFDVSATDRHMPAPELWVIAGIALVVVLLLLGILTLFACIGYVIRQSVWCCRSSAKPSQKSQLQTGQGEEQEEVGGWVGVEGDQGSPAGG